MNSPSERHIYVTNIDEKGDTTCLSCDHVNKYNQMCLWNTGEFSKDGSWWTWTCQGPESVPLVKVMNTGSNQKQMVLEENDVLHDRLMEKALPSQMDLKVTVAGGFKAAVRLLLPHDFVETKKYPMLVFT